MEQLLEDISEHQKATWNKFSAGWEKWDDLMMDFLQPMGTAIINKLQLKESDRVLDIASGTGEPGLSIASKLKKGKVTMTDLSEDMLNIARKNATKKRILNISTLVCDVSALPFKDNTYDAISCRFGFMFFPDMLLAAQEMLRVLKPGGKLATTVWNTAENNFWVTAIGGTINKHMQIPPPLMEAPGMFRCAQAGLVQSILKRAGFSNTAEKVVAGKLKCGTVEVYWDMMTDVAAPFVAALSKADTTTKKNIKEEVFEKLNMKFPDGNVQIDASAILISGEK